MNEQIKKINQWKNKDEWMNKWMNAWTNEWTNEWMNEWMNELMNEWIPRNTNKGIPQCLFSNSTLEILSTKHLNQTLRILILH